MIDSSQSCKQPLGNLTYRHFKAMLLKEYILYKRNILINMLSIMLPMAVFIVLALIRNSISYGMKPYPNQLDRQSVVIMPFPNSKQMGLANDSKENVMQALLQEFTSLSKIYDFHGFQGGVRGGNNMIGRWLADNCAVTNYNAPRRKYGIVGDFNKSLIIQQFVDDMAAMGYIRDNSGNLINDFNHYWMKNFPGQDTPFP